MPKLVTIPSGITPQKSTGVIILVGGIVAIILMVVLFSSFKGGFDEVLEFLGLRDSKEKKKRDAEIDEQMEEAHNPGTAWDPKLFLNAPAGTKILSPQQLEDAVDLIWGSVGIFWDDSDEGLAGIKKCSTKTQVSQVANEFVNKKDRDLLKFFEYHYDTAAQRKTLLIILEYVDKLPLR